MCVETTTASSKYVASVQTNGDGQITVTSVNDTTLLPADAANKTVTLTPQLANGTTMTVSSNLGQQVAAFSCKAGTMAPKYLPGSCK